MADNNIRLSITADVADLRTNVANAVSDLKGLADTVSNAGEGFRAANATIADTAPSLQAAGDHAEIAGDALSRLYERTKSVGDGLESLHGKLSIFRNIAGTIGEIAVDTGLETYMEASKQAAETAEAIEKLSRATGIGTRDLSGLRVVAIDTGTSFDVAAQSVLKLQSSMQDALTASTSQAAEAFHLMGIRVDDGNGRLRGTGDVLADVATKFVQYTDGANKAALQTALFGQAGGDLTAFLNRLGETGFAGATAEADRFNLAIGEKNIEAARLFQENARTVAKTLEGLKNSFLSSVVRIDQAQSAPALVSMGDGGPSLLGLDDGTQVTAPAKPPQPTQQPPAMPAAPRKSADDAQSEHDRQIAELQSYWDKRTKQLEDNLQRYHAVMQAGAAQEAAAPQARSGGTDQATREIAQITATLNAVEKPPPRPRSGGGSALLDILGFHDTSGQITQAMEDAKATLDRQMQNLQAEFTKAAPGNDTKLKDFVQGELGSDDSGATIQGKLAAMGGNTAQLTTVFDQALRLQGTYNQRSAQLASQGSEGWKRSWEGALTPISHAFSTSINGVITGTQTLSQAAARSAQSLVLSFTDASVKMLVKWTADRLAELTATTTVEAGKTTAVAAGTAARTATQATGAAAGKAAQDTADSSSIMSSAYSAAAGAYSAVAGIPVVGPVLAPIAAATAFAGVMAFNVISAEGGLDRVPFDGMPAVLHANESVMPAHVANPMRDFFANYAGPTAAANDQGGDTHVHLNYAPQIGGRLSRAEFEGALRDHAGVLARHVANTVRNRA